MVLLLTSGLEKKFKNKKENILYTGDWVLNDELDSDKFRKENKIFNSFWNNSNEVDKFGKVIFELRRKIIKKLYTQLNDFHKITYSKREWTLLLDPWLTYYLQSNYFRWLTINQLLKKNKKIRSIYFKNLLFQAPLDQNEFMQNIFSSDKYNHYIFQRILKFFSKKNSYSIKFTEHRFSEKKLIINKKSIFKFSFKRIFFIFLGLLSKKNKYLIDLNCGILTFIKLSLSLRQLPFKSNYYFENLSFLNNLKGDKINYNKIRDLFKFDLNKKDSFELFLSNYIAGDLPLVFVENFIKINNYINKIPFHPKIIISDIKFRHNTVFKFWLAKKINEGKKLITTDHGGVIGNNTSKILLQDEISDFSTKWHKPLKKKTIQMPAIHLLKFIKMRSTLKKYLLIVSNDYKKYPSYFHIGEMGAQMLNQFQNVKDLYLNVPKEIRINTIVKPFPLQNGWNSEARYKKIFKNNEQIIGNHQLNKHHKNSKIVLCTYPKTVFYQSMYSGPTILLYNQKFHREVREIQKIMDILKDAKIAFENPLEAAKHINKVWLNTNDWWESNKVKKAKKVFYSNIASCDKKSLYQWKNFLQKIDASF